MNLPMKAFRLVPLAFSLLIAGCATEDLLMQRRVDYGSSNNLAKAPLDIPPDLSAPQTTSTFNIPGRTLLNTDGSPIKTDARAKLVTAGGQRWLVIKGQAEKVWGETREFWLGSGFILTMDNSALGIMETDWQENRAKLPKDYVSQLLSKISARFASTGELDKYRIRMERGTDPETIEIYVTHRGLAEAYRDSGSTKTRSDKNEVDTIWIPRASDTELEAEMLVRMLQHFGLEEPAARQIVNTPETKPSAEIVALANGENVLSITDTFDRAWRRISLAIERSGFVITDRDRTKGIFYVRHADSDINREANSGFWSKLAFWSNTEEQQKAAQLEYQVHIKQESSKIILSLKAKEKADPALEKQLMSDLSKQLK